MQPQAIIDTRAVSIAVLQVIANAALPVTAHGVFLYLVWCYRIERQQG